MPFQFITTVYQTLYYAWNDFTITIYVYFIDVKSKLKMSSAGTKDVHVIKLNDTFMRVFHSIDCDLTPSN